MMFKKRIVIGVPLTFLLLVFVANVLLGNWLVINNLSNNELSINTHNLNIWVNNSPHEGDDAYEFNNNPYDFIPHNLYGIGSSKIRNYRNEVMHPSNLVNYEKTWLTDIYGLATQSDEDWYVIELTPGFLNLIIDLKFNHSLGNIDLEIYFLDILQDNSESLELTISFIGIGGYSFEDIEFINTNVSVQGIYYIKVFGQDTGNKYDLKWDDRKTRTWDDAFEFNNDSNNAYNISALENDLSGIRQVDFGVQYDNDFYSINIFKGFEHMNVFLAYDISEGMMGFKIYDYYKNEITGNFTLANNDYIDYTLPSEGIYFIRIFGDNSGNTYNLFWGTEEVKETNNLSVTYLIILFGAIGAISLLILLKYNDKLFDK